MIRDELLHRWQRPQILGDEDTGHATDRTGHDEDQGNSAKRKPAATQSELRERGHVLGYSAGPFPRDHSIRSFGELSIHPLLCLLAISAASLHMWVMLVALFRHLPPPSSM